MNVKRWLVVVVATQAIAMGNPSLLAQGKGKGSSQAGQPAAWLLADPA